MLYFITACTLNIPTRADIIKQTRQSSSALTGVQSGDVTPIQGGGHYTVPGGGRSDPVQPPEKTRKRIRLV